MVIWLYFSNVHTIQNPFYNENFIKLIDIIIHVENITYSRIGTFTQEKDLFI